MARAWEHNMVPFNNREDIRCWIDARARPARQFCRRCVQQGDPIRTPRLRSRAAAAQERAEKKSAAAPHQRADRRRLNADDAWLGRALVHARGKHLADCLHWCGWRTAARQERLLHGYPKDNGTPREFSLRRQNPSHRSRRPDSALRFEARQELTESCDHACS